MAFSIALIIILGLTADYLARYLKMPGLIGMLLVGVMAGPYLLNFISPEMMKVSGDFRMIALIVILLRAGFELNRDTLHQVGKAALIMSILPATFEIFGIWLVAPGWLQITSLEALILGSILAAVSPAVVVPLMIDFMDQGRGVKKGIPTLILGASAVDDVFVIVIFTVFLGMYGGSETNLYAKLAEIPISIATGIIVGLIAGYALYLLFVNYDWRPPKRTLFVLGAGITLTWLEKILHGIIPMAGLLGVMAIGFIILEKSRPIAHLISQKLKKIWVFAELLLFVLVGAQVNIQVAWKAGLAGAGVILVGLIFRSTGTYLSLLFTPLDWKERLFCVVAYIPKATVQAAIGAVPLTMGVASGEVILAVAVLSILFTAPLGAIGIKVMGNRILDHGEQSVYKFRDIREKLGLPHVGENILNKRTGGVWKIIEEKEVWISNSLNGDDVQRSKAKIPAIWLRLWSENKLQQTEQGKTISLYYSYQDKLFQDDWEILYDW